MAKTKISEWSTTPASNTDIDGINIAEGCAPSGINDAIRDLMAQVRSWQSGASGDPFNGPMNGTIGATTAYSGAFTTVSATGVITSTLATGTAPLTIASTTKVANLNVDLLDGADWASPAALGSTTPAAVSATTLSASGAVTLSGGTANGVTYLNGSKVLTSGSALTFDGTHFTVGGNAVFGKSTVTQSLGSTAGFAITDNATTTMYLNNTSSSVSSMWSSGAIGIGTGGGTYTERVRIDTSGNVSLGFTGANAKLNIQQSLASTASGSAIWVTDNATTSLYANNVSSGLSAFWSSGSLAFGAASGTFTEGMRLTSTGLGIGTSSPTYKLDVNGSNPRIRVNASTGTDYALYQAQNTGGSVFIGLENSAGSALSTGAPYSLNIYHGGAYPILFSTNAAERMRLDSAGNLGLGVTPSAWATSYKAFQIGVGGSLARTGAGAGDVTLTTNAYYDSTNSRWQFIYTGDYAARYSMTGAGIHSWYTSTASGTAGNAISFTQAMTLDASGNLGIGNTSPGELLVVGSSGRTTTYQSIRAGTVVGAFVADSTNSLYKVYTASNHPLVFGVNNNDYARIDTSGNLLVGTTSAGGKISVSGVGGSNSSSIYVTGFTDGVGTGIWMTPSANNATPMRFTNAANTTVGSITITSSATLYNVTSDQRLKENIQDADSASSLIDSLQVRKFDWKSDGNHQRYGFVAQELVTVAPEAVHQPTDTEQMMAVDYSKLVPMLVKEIQSLRARVAQLETN